MPFNYRTELHRYRRYYQSIENITKRPNTHFYTTTIFSFLAVSLFGWYAIRPTVQTILSLRRQIEDNTLVSKQMEEKITKLIEAQATFQTVTDLVPLIKEALPDTPEALSAMAQIRNLAAVTGASVSAISASSTPILDAQTGQSLESPDEAKKLNKPTTGIQTKKVIAVPMTVSLTGPFVTIRSFLDGIIDMRRILTIQSINITADSEPQNGVDGGVPLKLVLQLNVHYLAP